MQVLYVSGQVLADRTIQFTSATDCLKGKRSYLITRYVSTKLGSYGMRMRYMRAGTDSDGAPRAFGHSTGTRTSGQGTLTFGSSWQHFPNIPQPALDTK
jgi:hypothetical protein